MNRPIVTRSRILAATVLSIGLATAAQAQKPFAVQAHWAVGGEGRWDYLATDPGAHRLYLTHGTRVDVIDTTSGKSVGAITGLKGTHGVVFDPQKDTGYISDGAANEVVVFKRSTLEKTGSIPAGTNPDGLLFEPSSRTVWAFNGRSNNATVIDADTSKVLGTVALPGKPEFPTADGKGNVFVNIEDKNVILHLDAHKRSVLATWPLTGCDSPSGMAIDREGHRLFSVCDGRKMVVVDSNSGKILATPDIGDGPDAAGYDDAQKLAFASNGDGTLSVIDTKTYKTLQTLKTEPGSRTMSFDSSNGRIYLSSAKFGPKPAATAANPRPRPAAMPDSFGVVVVGR